MTSTSLPPLLPLPLPSLPLLPRLLPLPLLSLT